MLNENTSFEILFLDEFADRLKVGRSTVHNWKKKGILKTGKHYIKQGGVLRFFWEKNLLLSLNEDMPPVPTGKEETPHITPSPSEKKHTSGKIGINLDY